MEKWKHIWTPHMMVNEMVPYFFPLQVYLAEI